MKRTYAQWRDFQPTSVSGTTDAITYTLIEAKSDILELHHKLREAEHKIAHDPTTLLVAQLAAMVELVTASGQFDLVLDRRVVAAHATVKTLTRKDQVPT